MSKRQKPPEQKQLFNSLSKDFHELINNKSQLRLSIDRFLNEVIDEITLGIIFGIHRKYKTNAFDLEADVEEEADEDENTEDDLYSQNNLKKALSCTCPVCKSSVIATRFGNHLSNCMGIGRTSRSRISNRRLAADNKDRDCSYSEMQSEDEEEMQTSEEKRRKKKDRNGKKNKGTPKKVLAEPLETLNVDVEGDDDDLTILGDILHLKDYSNNTSPVDSACSSHSSSSKKKEKSKSKKSFKRDRSSPNSNLE